LYILYYIILYYIILYYIIWHMKVVRSSASHNGRLYPQEIFLVLIFTRGGVELRAMVRSKGICH